MCVTVKCWCSTVGYRVTVVCVTVMCLCSTFGYRVTVLCVCYCNVLVRYIWVQGYCVCVTVMCWCSTVGYRVTVVCVSVMCWCSKFGTGLLLCVCYGNVLVQYSWVQGYSCVLL